MLLLMSGQVESTPGPTTIPSVYSNSATDLSSDNLSTFEAFATTNVAWLCCKCYCPNQDTCYHSYELELSTPFTVLDSTQPSNLSGEIFSPCSDFDPPRHSSPIRRPERTNPNNWRYMIINCRSLRGKVAAFQATVDYIQPDCILGCESWLDSSVSSSEIFLRAYDVIRKDRNCEGGGVFIATKKDYITSQLPEADSESEAIWVKVHIHKSKSLVLDSVYSPPPVKLSVVEQIDQSFSNLNLGNSEQTVIIGGDFNLAGVDWENNTVLQNCALKPGANSLITSMTTHSLSQLQREPTRGDNVFSSLFHHKQTFYHQVMCQCPWHIC